MSQADPPREASTVKKLNGRSLPIFSNKTTHHFKEWAAARFVLKKTYCLYKNLMLQIDPLSSSCTQIKAISTPKKQLFGESRWLRKSSLQVQMSTFALLKNLLYLMNNCNCCCGIVELKNERMGKCFRAFNTVLFKQKLLQLVLWNK